MGRIQLSGQKFGRLLVEHEAGRNNKGEIIWKCTCDCGTVTQVLGARLRRKLTRSCGCLARELSSKRNGKGPGVAGLSKLLDTYQRSARARGLVWDLDDATCQTIFKAPCHYCGAEPTQVSRGKSKQSEYIYNGIDRVCNNLGYITTNVVPCCATCNYAKKGKTVEEFFAWARRIATRLPTSTPTPSACGTLSSSQSSAA